MEQLRLGNGNGPIIYAESWQDAARLFTKLSRVMAGLGAIEKRGTADRRMGGYAFTRYEDVAAAVRSRLTEEGIAFFATVNNDRREEVATKSGGTMANVVLDMTFTFADGESGAIAVCPWKGEASDTSDKATSKAATMGLKYFLMRGFIVSSEDDLDPDAGSPERGKRTRAKAGNGASPPNGESLKEQLERLLNAVNERTDGYYNHPAHMLNAISKQDPSIGSWSDVTDQHGRITKSAANELIALLIQHVSSKTESETA